MTDQKHPTMRLRITFAKTDAMRYTSHLDLHRSWERTIRRAGLPLAYSHGFNPRPKINLASALPLGFTSDCELIDIWFESQIPIDEIKTGLESAQPPGIEIIDIEDIQLDSPKLQKQVKSSEYQVTFCETIPDLASRLQKILDSDSIIRNRRGKDYDLRGLIEAAKYLSTNDVDQQQISLYLTTQDNATGRPDEVLGEMEVPFHTTNIKRTRLILN